jgi:ABC-2 type transport system permease protein
MKNYLSPIVTFTKFNLLRFFRDKIYIFFMLIMPAMFLIIFGMIYGNDFSSFNVAIFDDSQSEIAHSVVESVTAEDGILTRVDVEDMHDAEDRLIRGEISAIVTLPADFGQPLENGLPSGQFEVIYSQSGAQAGQAISALLGGISSELNRQITGQPPQFTVSSEPLNRDGLTNFDYVFAGLLGYTVLTIGVMGLSNVLPADKESGATKRLRATSAKASQLILGYALTFLVIGVLALAIMIALGVLVFDFNMRGSWLTFGVFTAFSTMMMMGFGLTVGGWAKNEAQASAASNMLLFPMMFLSGVFFPLFLMPEFVQTIARFVPLTPIVDGIRLIITENFSLIDVAPQIGIIAVWTVVIYTLAIKTFKWE